jgi:8-oxo-dGTP pyrophosphatase MutT (NUDIX family)
MLTKDIVTVAEHYARRFPEYVQVIGELLELAAAGADLTSRKEFRGHVTCGAIVLTPENRFLMIRHRSLDRWLFPGGHLEERDTSLRQAALRELAEETGLAADAMAGFGNWLGDLPAHIDCHPIPANPRKQEPEHRHWDFQFAFRGQAEVTALQTEEVVNWSCVSPDHLPGAIRARLRALIAPTI